MPAVGRKKAVSLGRAGRVYTWFRGRPYFEYPCTIRPRASTVTEGCCHFLCRMAALRAAGQGQVADRLEANAKAKDWLRNWGRLLYDPELHGRDPERRQAAAAIVRHMRRDASLNYATVVCTGAWLGALLPRS